MEAGLVPAQMVLPAYRFCQHCGHIVTVYLPAVPDELDLALGFENGCKAVLDVIEESCRHDNGSYIQKCPACRKRVGMWGCGPAGGMECECWSEE